MMRFLEYGRSATSVATEHKTKNVLGNEGIWALLFGAIAFIIVQYVIGDGAQSPRGALIRHNDYLYIWPLIGVLSSALLLFVVAKLFCTKNSQGLLELNDKHRWVRAFGFIVGVIMSTCLGWLFVLCITLWISTL